MRAPKAPEGTGRRDEAGKREKKAAKKSRSVFGPKASSRPDVLTDAETVVFPTVAKSGQSASDMSARAAQMGYGGARAPAPPGAGFEPRNLTRNMLRRTDALLRLPDFEPTPTYTPTRRRTWISRGALLVILGLQSVLSLRLRNTAFEDESLYLYSGYMQLQHLLHGSALQGAYSTYFSGAPVLYPVLAAVLDQIGGLTLTRVFSLGEMLSITALLYSVTRMLFNERVGLCAAALFAVTETAIFLGNFATYDATCLLLLAAASWIVVRTAASRWPLFLLAAPIVTLAVAVKYAGALFVPSVAVLAGLAAWPHRSRRAVVVYPIMLLAATGLLLYGTLKVGGHSYLSALQGTTTDRAQGDTPLTQILWDSVQWGGLVFVVAVVGAIAYAMAERTEPDELIAPPGSTSRRVVLGVVLAGTALLAPAYQAHLHTAVSLQKHIGFGLFFAAPVAGLGLARIVGDHFRRPHFGIAVWSFALVLGMTQSETLYHEWPSSAGFVTAFSRYLQPQARYLVEVPEVPIYYLEGNQDAQPDQFTSTYNITYQTPQGQSLTGNQGYAAAIRAGYFHVIAYDDQVTPGADAVIAQALEASSSYRLASQVHVTDDSGPGIYDIWVKTPASQHKKSRKKPGKRLRKKPRKPSAQK